jgi:hypothetical protein
MESRVSPTGYPLYSDWLAQNPDARLPVDRPFWVDTQGEFGTIIDRQWMAFDTAVPADMTLNEAREVLRTTLTEREFQLWSQWLRLTDITEDRAMCWAHHLTTEDELDTVGVSITFTAPQASLLWKVLGFWKVLRQDDLVRAKFFERDEPVYDRPDFMSKTYYFNVVDWSEMDFWDMWVSLADILVFADKEKERFGNAGQD